MLTERALVARSTAEFTYWIYADSCVKEDNTVKILSLIDILRILNIDDMFSNLMSL